MKRQLPAASEAEIVKRADAGEWILSLSADDGEEDQAESPLPAPSATTSSATS